MEVIQYRSDGPEAVVTSAFGRNADWLRNIEAIPGPEVVLGAQRFIACHRFLDEDEAVKAMVGYEHRNWLIRPIIRAVLSLFLGDDSTYYP
jgi:hypothetical protein